MSEKITKEEFVERSVKKHGNIYDYSDSQYVNMRSNVKIVCKIHGEFFQNAMAHIRRNGCKKCSFKKRTIANDDFINRSNEIHKNKYNYELTVYKKCHDYVTILCPEHGAFRQKAFKHLQGQGCKICNKKYLDNDKFIKRAKKVHGDKYDYSLVDYVNYSTKIKILCPDHGEFFMTPSNHIKGVRCRFCSGKFSTKERFIKDAKKIHDDKYDYSPVEYKRCNVKVQIICKKHGIFEQTPTCHLAGSGCLKCASSTGENMIRNYLEKNNINFKEQKTFKTCINIETKRRLKFDFYLPNYNLLIEYDGKQHFEPVKYFGGKDKLKDIKTKDNIKNDWCKNNNIKLLRIPYFDKKNIINILNNVLK